MEFLTVAAVDPVILGTIGVVLVALAICGVGILALAARCYHKVKQGTALIRNGFGKRQVSFEGMWVFPVVHRMEVMDISVKRVEIERMAENGLVCKDNMRADVKVAFFVRVNPKAPDVLNVAESLGCVRASDPQALVEFFDAKFSEALKTVGKQFDFVHLYTNRQDFKHQILEVIGKDLNGYVLDDAAIDYLEQTPAERLDANNILDAEGIKKITELTAQQAILANGITRDKEKTIKKQDVEAREAILELERQQVDAEQKQAREIAEVTARESASARVVEQENRLKAENARIASDEQIAVAEENKERQIIVARKNKERTDKVETERVERDRELENTERQRVVTLADIEKEKAVEVEKKNIQDVIRERVAVERTVVEEEQRKIDVEAFATAERQKTVAITKASEEAEQSKVKQTVDADAKKEAAKHTAEQIVIEAEAQRAASEKEADARKILADAKAQEEAVIGIGEARAIEAKAQATEKFGTAEANVINSKGEAEANAMAKKYHAEAGGINEKAEAMKLFNAAGKEHEEFKLELNKNLELGLAEINVRKEIAEQQALIVGEALKQAQIDIVGGDAAFFDKIVAAVGTGKSVDYALDKGHALMDVKETFFNGDPSYFKAQVENFIGKFGINTEDVKNLTVSALMAKLFNMTDDDALKLTLQHITAAAQQQGVANETVGKLLGK